MITAVPRPKAENAAGQVACQDNLTCSQRLRMRRASILFCTRPKNCFECHASSAAVRESSVLPSRRTCPGTGCPVRSEPSVVVSLLAWDCSFVQFEKLILYITKIKYPLYLAVDLLLCTACNMTLTAQDIAPARPPQAAADQQGMYISGKLSVATQQKRALQIQ